MTRSRVLTTLLLLFSGLFVSLGAQEKRAAAAAQDQAVNQCRDTNPFGYDHSALGQVAWCGKCQTGERQAPINIPSDTPISPNQPTIEFIGYETLTDLVVYNYAYNLKINYKDGPAKIKIGPDTFTLQEFHFHRPSEEAIGNRRFPMGIHFVHLKDQAGCDTGVPGCVAVVTVLIEESAAARSDTSELLTTLFNHFPPPIGHPPDVQIKLLGLLPDNKASYYQYDGSLTTPPCTENLTFYVLKTPLKVSAQQLAQFERRYPSPNARDVQPLNGRPIVNKQ